MATTTVAPFTRRARVGRTEAGEFLVLDIEWGNRLNPTRPYSLSICGSIFERGRDVGGGQCVDMLREVTTFSLGWNAELAARVADIWERWHLNDMRAGCEHQREMSWGELHCPGYHRSVAETCLGTLGPNGQAEQLAILGYPTDRQPEQRYSSGPGVTWRCVFDPVSVPCPVCGYAYGSKWLHEDVPADVLDLLANLTNQVPT